ncbi:MAG: glycosyl hydrolase [Ignavibacteria bacterium]|nr:glycosyl hydrolase [Ignavibacteria bacterium]
MRSCALFCAAALLCASADVLAQQTFTTGMLGVLRPRSIGPATMSGRVSDLDVVNGKPNIIYVGAAAGGIWKSINGGVSFEPVFDDFPQSIGTIHIDQDHPDTVWVGTGESWTRNSVSYGKGLYRTTDAGKTWTSAGLDSTERISMVAIHPRNPSIVFVAAPGPLFHDSPHRGLYRTTDFGTSWTNVLPGDMRTGCTDVLIDPQDPDRMLASLWTFRRTPYSFVSGGPIGGIYSSNDAGKTWQKVSAGLPTGDIGRVALARSPKNPNLIFASIEAKESGMFVSTDGGKSWTRRYTGSAVDIRPFYFSRIVCDPSNDSILYKCGINLYRSDDQGNIFSVTANSAHSDHHAVWIDPKNSEHIIIGTDGGVYESFNKGKSVRFYGNLPIGQFYHVATDNRTAFNVYGGLQDNGSWAGPSSKPGGIANGDWKFVGGGDGFYVVPDRGNADIVVWESQGGNIVRNNLATGEEKTIAPKPDDGSLKLRYNWNAPIVRGNRAGVLFVASQYLYKSTNAGEDWKRISPDLTTNDSLKLGQDDNGGLTLDNSSAENHCTIFTISESQRDSLVIWAGTDDGNIQITRDGGTSWKNVASFIQGVPKGSWVTCVEPSVYQDGECYVTLDNHMYGDMRTYVAHTTDYGATWTTLATSAVTGYAHVVRQDHSNPKLLFLGTEDGLFLSFSGGTSWLHVTSSFPRTPVRDLELQDNQNALAIATHGRSLYILDNVDVLRGIDVSADQAPVTVIKPKPFMRRYANSGGGWFGGDADYVGQSKSQAPLLWYVLREKHVKGSFVIRIKDASGTVIRTLPASGRKGVNMVELALSYQAPLSPKSEVGGVFGTFSGPLLPSGRYTVELDKAGEIYTTTIDVVPDTTLGHSATDIALQYQTMQAMYELYEQLAVTTERVQVLIKQLESTHDSLGNTTVFNALVELNKTLVNTKQGAVTGEEQIREKLAGLYGEVNGYLGRPGAMQLALLEELRKRIMQATNEAEKLLSGRLTESREQTFARLKSQSKK